MGTEPLYMLRMRVDAARLAELGRRRHLPPRGQDNGYLVHCQLGELFGEKAPRPFTLVDEQSRMVTVYGYSDVADEELRAHADAFADPAIHKAIEWATFAGKPMPLQWKAGQRLGFELRACPVLRMDKEGEHHRKGAEVDAFLARCWAVGKEVKVDREAVYCEWLAAQFERRGGAKLLSARLTGFKRERLVRRDHEAERKSHIAERPDARLEGELEVTESAAFVELLRGGVGRHRSFGFGMLLLRPARC